MFNLHSIPARVYPEPCETIPSQAHPRLRGYVVGYAGFRSAAQDPVLHRVLPSDDIAVVVAFLAGPDAQWITGQNLRVTGGLLV